jgi:hypothetical protein
MFERRLRERKLDKFETFNRFEYVSALEKVIILEGITEYYEIVNKQDELKTPEQVIDYLTTEKKVSQQTIIEHQFFIENACSLFDWHKLEQYNYSPQYIKNAIKTEYIGYALYHFFEGVLTDSQITQLQSIVEEEDFELNTDGIYFKISVNLQNIVSKKVNRKKKELLEFLKEFVESMNYSPAVVLDVFLSKKDEAGFLAEDYLGEDEVVTVKAIFSVTNDPDQAVSILHDSAHIINSFNLAGNIILGSTEEMVVQNNQEFVVSFYNRVLHNELLSYFYAGNFTSVIDFVKQYVFNFERQLLNKGMITQGKLNSLEDPRFLQLLELSEEEFVKKSGVFLHQYLKDIKFHQHQNINEQIWFEIVAQTIVFWNEVLDLFLDLEPEYLRKIYARLKFGEPWPVTTSSKIYDHFPFWFNELLADLA